MNHSTVYQYFSLIRKVPVSVVLLACIMLTACDRNGVVNHQVNGTLDIQNVDCDVAIPGQVKVHAQLFKGNNSVGASGNFGSNGPFNLTIQWPQNLGQPEGWRVTAVTRLDGSEICTGENTCAEGRQCLDMATKVRRAPLNSPINWRVRCTCMGGGVIS